jgi:methylated-DNA-[protein]-cysteine S-methyltransferase
LKIPYGQSRSYAELASLIDKPKAARAVGNALGANPIAILIPCHRVIASDGTLGGFGGGLPVKQYLLALEKRSGADS